jgi:hypothetical protein
MGFRLPTVGEIRDTAQALSAGFQAARQLRGSTSRSSDNPSHIKKTLPDTVEISQPKVFHADPEKNAEIIALIALIKACGPKFEDADQHFFKIRDVLGLKDQPNRWKIIKDLVNDQEWRIDTDHARSNEFASHLWM